MIGGTLIGLFLMFFLARLALKPVLAIQRALKALGDLNIRAQSRLRSAAQGVVDLRLKLNPAPYPLTPVTGRIAGYWDTTLATPLGSPCSSSYGEPLPYLVLQAEGQTLLVDNSRSPLGLPTTHIIPHTHTAYVLYTKDYLKRIKLVNQLADEAFEQLNQVAEEKSAKRVEVAERVFLSDHPIRLFGSLETFRGTSVEQLVERLSRKKGWSADKRQAMSQLAQRYAKEQEDGRVTLHFLGKAYGTLSPILRPEETRFSLPWLLVRRELIPLLVFGSIFILSLGVLAGFVLGFLIDSGTLSSENIIYTGSVNSWLLIELPFAAAAVYLVIKMLRTRVDTEPL